MYSSARLGIALVPGDLPLESPEINFITLACVGKWSAALIRSELCADGDKLWFPCWWWMDSWEWDQSAKPNGWESLPCQGLESFHQHREVGMIQKTQDHTQIYGHSWNFAVDPVCKGLNLIYLASKPCIKHSSKFSLWTVALMFLKAACLKAASTFCRWCFSLRSSFICLLFSLYQSWCL